MKTTTNIYNPKRTDVFYSGSAPLIPMPRHGTRVIRLCAAILCRAVAIVMMTTLLLGLHSCSADDTDDADSRPTQTVVFKITPGTPGDLNATRATRATQHEDGRDGEFINTLCVYMVDANGFVEMVIKPDFVNDTNIDQDIRNAAAGGNLKEYTSEEFQITSGRRSFYAFANWEGTAMATVVNYNKGDKITRSEIESLVIDDPASNVDIKNKKYIPMFKMLEEKDIHEYLEGSNTIEIPIDRLVSRLRLTLQPNSELKTLATIKEITISGFAKSVALVPGTTLTNEAYDIEKVFTPSTPFDAKEGTALLLGDVYVNETQRSLPFTVEMEVTQYGRDVTYTGRTSTKDLPRNHIFPLNVKLSALELNVKAEVIAPPIGVVMNPVAATVDDNYNIKIVEGATFTITPKMPGVTVVNYEWLTNAPTETDWKTQASADGSLSGTVTAVPGKTITFQLNVSWQTNGQTFFRPYNITITTIAIDDSWDITSSAARWGTLNSTPAFWNK